MNATRARLAFCLLVAVWGYAFWPSLSAMLATYWNSSYDHQGLLVIPLVLVLIWYKRAALHRITISCNIYGLLLLLVFSAIWLLAVITKLSLLEQASIISMLLAIIFMSFGKKITSILYLPLLSLFLLLPIGQHLYSALQHLFSWLLVQSLSLTNLAVYWEKDQVHVGDKSYMISDLLKSLQYVMLYLTFGIAYAFVQAKRWYQGLIITANFIIMPFILNLLSLIIVIIVNRWFDFKLSDDNLVALGWTLTALGLILAVILGFILGDISKNKHAFNDIDWRSHSSRASWLVILIAIICLVTVPIVAKKLKTNPHYASNNILVTEPGKLSKWTGPSVLKNSTANSKFIAYSKNKDLLVLSLINSNKSQDTLYDHSKWHKIKESTINLKSANTNIPVTEIVLKNNNQSKIIWSVYYVNGHLTNNHRASKVLESLYTLSKHGAETGIIAVSTDVTTELGAGRELLKDFFTQLDETKTVSWLR